MSSPIKSGVYFIRNVATGTILTLTNGSTAEGTLVVCDTQFPLDDRRVPWQLWVVVERNSVYTLENASGQTFIDLDNGRTEDGTHLVGYEQSSGKISQQWTITVNANRFCVIKNNRSNTNMDLTGAGGPGTAVQIYSGGDDTGNTNQLWEFLSA